MKNERIEEYGTKEQQRKFYRGQKQECHVCLSQNLNPGKTAAIMTMLEQIMEARSWKEARGVTDNGSFGICTQHSETVEHLVPGCTKSEHLTRHNQRLTILALSWVRNRSRSHLVQTTMGQKDNTGE